MKERGAERMIDAHQHFWNKEILTYPWLTPQKGCLYRNFEPVDLRDECQKAGVEKTIVVQATSSMDETYWLLSLAEQNDFIGGVVAWVDLTDDKLPATLEQLKKHKKFCGVRHQVENEADVQWLLRKDVLRGLEAVCDANITFDALIRHYQFWELEEVFTKIPSLRVVIDHAGKPKIKEREFENWNRDISAVAKLPVYCKLSGLLTEANIETWTINDIQPYADKILEVFGAERVMFGSDWPVSTKAAGYQEVVKTTIALLHSLSANERSLVLGQNTATFYGLN